MVCHPESTRLKPVCWGLRVGEQNVTVDSLVQVNVEKSVWVVLRTLEVIIV